MFREKPNMAVVLWEPPAGSIDPLLSREGRGQTEEDNNNTSVVDLNSISTPGYAFLYIFLLTELDTYLSFESHSDALISLKNNLNVKLFT